jgi:hypothetical protein
MESPKKIEKNWIIGLSVIGAVILAILVVTVTLLIVYKSSPPTTAKFTMVNNTGTMDMVQAKYRNNTHRLRLLGDSSSSVSSSSNTMLTPSYFGLKLLSVYLSESIDPVTMNTSGYNS